MEPMPFDKNIKICVTLPSDADNQLFRSILDQNGIKNFKTFGSCHMAFENATRTQYDLFITAIKLADQPGIILLQRLRNTGNYGLEPHLFVGENIDASTASLFSENDVEYVLGKPYTPERILNKLFFIFRTESHLPAPEAAYREAKSAFINKLNEMAWDMACAAEVRFGSSEKFDLLIGDILLSQGKISDARARFEKALKRNANSVAAKNKLASCFMAEKNFEAAKHLLDKLAKENPLHIKLLENAGLSNLETGNFDLAKQQMSQLQNLDSKNKTAAAVITQVKVHQGDFNGLATDLSKTHTEEEIVRMLNTAGVKLSKEDKVNEAITIYLDCLKVIKNSDFAAKVHFNLGLSYQRLQNKNNAIQHLQKAVELVPKFEKAQELLDRLTKKVA
jgi:tetratricopeptide (TPR) repeat protein